MVEHDFYTVVFGVSRAVGCLSNGVWSRAFGLPIERPNSIDIAFIEKLK
jgi:citrate synthase